MHEIREAEKFQIESNDFAHEMEGLKVLAASVAHDFNNLLTTIQGNIELVLYDENLDPKSKRHLQAALIACQNGSSLSRSLVGFAKKQVLEMEEMSLAALVFDTVSVCSGGFGNTHQIRVDENLRTTNPIITGCYSSLSHVLLNLIKNAHEAMPDGGNIDITFLCDNGYVHLYVQDYGIGMDEEIQKKAFTPFFTTKEKDGRGTGLGLSMAKGIMKEHRGAVHIQSIRGEGTTIALSWPLLRVEMPDEQAPEVEDSPDDAANSIADVSAQDNSMLSPNSVPGNLPNPVTQAIPVVRPGANNAQKLRVIVVDDDQQVLGTVPEMIRKLTRGNVESCQNPQDALGLIERLKKEPDWMFIDYSMPQMSGMELIQQILDLRKNFRTDPPFAKLVLISGHPPEKFGDYEPYRQNQVVLLQKPFSMETLDRLLKNEENKFKRKLTSRIQVPDEYRKKTHPQQPKSALGQLKPIR